MGFRPNHQHMRIDLVTTNKGFLSLRTSWNCLLSKSKSDTIFLTWEWISSWWGAYAKDAQLWIVLVYDDAEALVGIVPFCLRSRKWLPFRRLKVLQFLGDGSWD